jgi:hypothetical protein
MAWVKKMAVEMPITADSRFLDATTRVPPSKEAEYWSDRNFIPNFLKHADRDPTGFISASEIDNLELLTSVVSAYLDLVRESPPPELLPLISYYKAQHDIDPSDVGDIADVARDIRSKPEQLRKKFTWVFLQQYIASAAG